MTINRAIIFVFYEKNGVVRNYLKYCLRNLKKLTENIVVIVNGVINEEGKNFLKELEINYVIRENRGLDFAGYKCGIEYFGYKNIKNYDELVLMNDTCYGPIYPFEKLFEEMNGRDCDFWGITKHPKNNDVNEHIQSYFIVFKNSILASTDFEQYWKNLPEYTEYQDVVNNLEIMLTKHFEDKGFISDSYIPADIFPLCNPLFATDEMLEKYYPPLIKRKAICGAFEEHAKLTATSTILKTLDFIKNKTNYDIENIYEDIINTKPMSEIRQCLHLNYVLSDKHFDKEIPEDKKVALILYIYYPDLVEYCYDYAKSIPETSDIYIVTSREDTEKVCQEKFKDLKCAKLEIRKKVNRGRDVSAYLITCKDIFEKYDYVCCMHDKKSPTYGNSHLGKEISDSCFDNCLKSPQYVKNVINTFEENPHLGMLCPFPMPYIGYWMLVGNEIGANLDNIKNLYNEFNLKIPFDKTPIVPFGAMFWVRKGALKLLLNKNWQFEDFPDEPMPPDGTLSHAIERFYPYIIQQAGFLSGYISFPHSIASKSDGFLFYLKKRFEKILINKKKSFFKNIFEIKNEYYLDKKIKTLTIFGNTFIKN